MTPDDDQFGYHQCFGTLIDAEASTVSGEDELFDAAAELTSAVETGVALDGAAESAVVLDGMDAADSGAAVAGSLIAKDVEALEQPDRTTTPRSAVARRAFMIGIIPIFTNRLARQVLHVRTDGPSHDRSKKRGRQR